MKLQFIGDPTPSAPQALKFEFSTTWEGIFGGVFSGDFPLKDPENAQKGWVFIFVPSGDFPLQPEVIEQFNPATGWMEKSIPGTPDAKIVYVAESTYWRLRCQVAERREAY